MRAVSALLLAVGVAVAAAPAAGTTAQHVTAPPPDAAAWEAGPTPQDTAWDDRGTLVLGYSEALAALGSLPADAPAPVSWAEGGSRTGWFGQAWEDVDGDSCDTRNEILARDLVDTDFSRAPGTQGILEGTGQGAAVCPDATVWSGTLHDPYTGSTIAFQRGQGTSEAVQIDHVVPLNYLYAHGAWQWDARTRLLVANDPLNLLAVDGRANQGKSACGPATCPMGSTETGTWSTADGQGWWPTDDYRCQYAARFVSVAAAYGLGLPEADVEALRQTLTDCAAGGDGAPSTMERTTRVLRTVTTEPALALLAAAGLVLIGLGALTRSRRLGRVRRHRR